MSIGVNNYSNNNCRNNNLSDNFLTAMNVPVIAEEIYGALPPADQINLSSTCRDARLSLQSIMNIRLGGIFCHSNKAFNKLEKITKRRPHGVNKNSRNILEEFIKRVSFDYGVKKPQYNIPQIIKWFKSLDLVEGEIADYLTWDDLYELGMFSHEDGVAAAQSATQELAQASDHLMQTIAQAEEAAGVKLMGFPAFRAQFDQMVEANQQLVTKQTLSTAELIYIALDIQAEAGSIHLARKVVEKETIPLREKLVKAIKAMQSVPLQVHNVFGLGPNRLHREIIEENLINILSFGKKINLINYLGINLSEREDRQGNNIVSLENYKYELSRLVNLIKNDEIPFPIGIIGVFLLDHVQDEIKKGNKDAVKCLQKINNLDYQNKNWKTLLHLAANVKKWKIASLLLEMGASPDIKDLNQKTPLHWAASFAKNGNLLPFIGKSTNLNVRDDNSCAPLHWAVDASNWENVRLLLEAGANPNIADSVGRTVLHWVAQTEENSVVQLLLENGADANLRDGLGNTPLHYTLNRLNIESTVLLLNKNARIDIKNRRGDTSLHLLVKTQHKELVKLALKKGIYKNLNVINKEGENALDIALFSNNKEIGLLLLKKGARPNKYVGKLLFYRLIAWRLQAIFFRVNFNF